MSDFVATLLGLAFTIIVCLLAVQAILGPWVRIRRTRPQSWLPPRVTEKTTHSVGTPETQPVQSL